MELTLVLPNILDIAPAALALADVPALSRVITSADGRVSQPGGPLGVACAALGIERQHDWPVAPWLARGAGIDAGSRYWLCATPVTLDVGRDEGRLAGIVRDLDVAESAALLASLRTHFASDGVEFVERGAGRWWIGFDAPQRIDASLPDAAFGQPLPAHLPHGADAPRWRRWQSEIQMLLFEHPVNRAREKRHAPLVNFLWVWGGGTLQASHRDGLAARRSATTVFSRVAWLCDLARAAGAGTADPPQSLTALLTTGDDRSLVWLDELDATAPDEELVAIDAAWAAALHRAVDRREIALRLVVGGAAAWFTFEPQPRSAMRRFRDRWVTAPDLSVPLASLTTP